MNGIDYAQALRGLADFYEAHPDIAIPLPQIVNVYGVEDTKEMVSQTIEILKPCRKEWDGSLLKITRDFGGVTLKFVFERSAVCTRRVVGHKTVPSIYYPEHTEEIIEWDCAPSILAGAEEEGIAGQNFPEEITSAPLS